MSTLLALRMMQTLQNYDANLDAEIKDSSEFIQPMPFIMI
jgi:hypothetical protein